WPKDYWPESTAPENSEEWEQRKEAFLRDREAMLGLIQNVNQDLCAAFEHAHGHTLFREGRSEEHTSELQSHENLVCRLLLGEKNQAINDIFGRAIYVSRLRQPPRPSPNQAVEIVHLDSKIRPAHDR